MKTKLLFPNQFKKIGLFVLIPSAILGFMVLFLDFKFEFLNIKMISIFSSGFQKSITFFGVTKNNITDEIVAILFIMGALFVAFSKEKNEDEFIAKNRLESLVWATYINYIILLFCIVFFYELEFLTVMVLNMFTILIFFIIRFYYVLFKSKKALSHEK